MRRRNDPAATSGTLRRARRFRRPSARQGTMATTLGTAPLTASPTLARDRAWAGNLRVALGCTTGILAALLLLDWGAGSLDPARADVWTAIAMTLLAILFPQRVTAGEGNAGELSRFRR
ncbi:hypothetical protein QMK19_38715 [Streptomyces sp. H10-C2]|uniref:hypothetical protein n=1 Tax=unclassified Streptomyces TaxID=2593676 RepID=UPI0024BB146E|nr:MULTISPECIES: hypothetical protein [unclassified Streptomyces]MDJ0347125.1 hypothetical protein [Streptomyces sp. PH10-H1]MDJ0375371.1 hypothetical protein [Streptomyces sp. H10-C2]